MGINNRKLNGKTPHEIKNGTIRRFVPRNLEYGIFGRSQDLK